MTKYTTIDHCRLCEHPKPKQVIDFGLSALANAYPASLDATEDLYPLSVAKCEACGHVQLEQTVDPDVLFKNYLYSSSDSPALVAHFGEFARSVAMTVDLESTDGILEIGCNDGGLLNEFRKLGYSYLYGVDPAGNVASRAAQKTGATIFHHFITQDVARSIVEKHGQMKLIVATNVFAHIANMVDLMTAIDTLLVDDGVFVFENAYLFDTIGGVYVDQVYHEHLQYYGVKPLVKFFGGFGMEMFHVERNGSQGGSIRVFVKKKGKTFKPILESVCRHIEQEENADLYSDQTYARFSSDVRDFVLRFGSMMAEWRSSPATFSCYGCPAKFTLLSKLLGLGPSVIDYVIDDSPVKQGRYSPGMKVPIVSGTHFRLHPTDYCIITAWNMADAIIRRNPEYRGQWVNPYSGIIPRPCDQVACNCGTSGVKTG